MLTWAETSYRRVLAVASLLLLLLAWVACAIVSLEYFPCPSSGQSAMLTLNFAEMHVVLVCLFRILSAATLVSSHLHYLPRQQRGWNTSSPTVDLGYANYRGIRSKSGVDEYLGMRFAQAPLGDLRFRAPRDPIFQSGVQDASKVSKWALPLILQYRNSLVRGED